MWPMYSTWLSQHLIVLELLSLLVVDQYLLQHRKYCLIKGQPFNVLSSNVIEELSWPEIYITKLKIICQRLHMTIGKWLKLITNFLNYYTLEERAVLNVTTKRLMTTWLWAVTVVFTHISYGWKMIGCLCCAYNEFTSGF